MTPSQRATDGTVRRARKPRRHWQDNFLAALEEQGTVTRACKAAGVSRSTAYRERQADEDFALAWADVESTVTDTLEAKAVQVAMAGDTKMLEFLLKARRPERYRESYKVEHSGSIKTDLQAMSDAELEALAAGLATKRDGAR